MNRIVRLPALAAALVAITVSVTGCDKLKARDQLNKGVEAFKAQKYEEAIRHFQEASKDDPTLPTAKQYLATALSQNVVPGLTTPDNLKTAQQAIDVFQEVLQEHPNDINSLKGIASLYYNTDKFNEARDWQKKVLAIDPKDPEAAYTVGAIDWTQAHQNILKILNPLGANDDGNGNVKIITKKVCPEVQEKNGSLVEEGLKYLTMAVDNRPGYDEAMQYLNLIYRRKADVDCGNDAAVKEDVAKAMEWTTKALGTRKENEAKKDKSGGGIQIDSNGGFK